VQRASYSLDLHVLHDCSHDAFGCSDCTAGVDGSGSVSLFFAVTIQTTTAMAIRAATTAPPDIWRGIRQPYGEKRLRAKRGPADDFWLPVATQNAEGQENDGVFWAFGVLSRDRRGAQMNFFDHEGVGKRLKLITSGFQNSCGCFKFMFQVGIGLVIGDRGDVLSACPCSKCNRAQFGEQTERAASPLSRGSTPTVMTRTADLGEGMRSLGTPLFRLLGVWGDAEALLARATGGSRARAWLATAMDTLT
jgi:hypothetical protein